MYVAKSRQVPPENAFSRRRKAQAELEAKEAAKRMPEPVAPEQTPDLDALREAAARAAALVHGPVVDSDPPVEAEPVSVREPVLIAVDEVDQFTAVVEDKPRGRPKSSAAEERANRVLDLVKQAGSDGTTKAALVQATGEPPPNVNTSLQRLKDEGKIDSKPIEGSKALRWFAV
jgi:hypothetical protein